MSKAQPSSKTNTNANTNQSIATLVLSDSESEASEEFEPEYVGAKRGRESSSELELSFKRLKTLAIPRSVVFRNTDQLSAQKSEKEELSPEMSDGEKLKKARNLLHNREFESAEALLRAMKKPGAEAKVYLAFIQQQLGRKLSHRGMKRKMKEAKELYEKAANSATLSTNFRDSFFKIEAQFRLGMLLVRGEGEPVNHLQRARHYLTLAAQAGHPQAAAELSKRFSIDVPKPKDSLLSSLARGWWSFAGVEDAPHR